MDFDLGCSSTKRFCSRSMRDFRRVRSRVMGSEIEGDWKPVSLAESNSPREEQKDNHGEHKVHRGNRKNSPVYPCVPLCPLWLRISTVCSATDPDLSRSHSASSARRSRPP